MLRERWLKSRRAGLVVVFVYGVLGAAWLVGEYTVNLLAQVQAGGTITGRIIASESLPDRIKVQLLAEGEMIVEERYTDSNGNFFFTSLPNGTYTLVIQVKGFRPVRRIVTVDLQIMPRNQTEILLERATDDASKPSNPALTVTPNRYEINIRHNAESFDPKAVKELEKGNELQQNGNFKGALSHYQKALSIAPNFYPALTNMGAIYLRERDIARAEASYQKALELNPDEGESYINLGHALYEKGEYQPAVARLEEGLKRSPRSATGHFFVGSACLKLGDLDKAETYLKRAYSLDPPGMARARLQLANLYLKRNDLQAASTQLESYLQANPSDAQAPAIKKMLANIKAH